MIRLLACLCLAGLAAAAEDVDLPPLAPAADPPPAAVKAAKPTDPAAGPAAQNTTAALTAAALAKDEAAAGPAKGKPAKGDDETVNSRIASPDLQRWTDRNLLLPRLAADLVNRSAPVIRPVGADYHLKAGDMVRVVAWGGQVVNERIPVAASGDLAVPGFGLVPVGGATTSEAQTRVLDLVRSHFKQGGAVVAVEQPAAQAVTVVGEVANPGYLVLPPGGTVLEALAAAGGVLPRGSLRSIRISAEGRQSECDLYRLAIEGDAAGLVPLPAGALVFVPLAGPQVQIFGAVRRMVGIELKAGEPLGEALRLAGGLAADADPATVRLLREGPRGQELSQLSLEALSAVAISDGDRVLVSLRRDLAGAAGSVKVLGAVRSPGVYPLSAGLTLDQVLQLAGGTLPEAGADIQVQRLLPVPQVVTSNGVPQIVNYATLIAPPGDTTLLALDEISVPDRPKADPARSGVSIGGAVGKPGLYAFTPGMTLRDLVLIADRPLPNAQVDRVDLVRSQLNDTGQRSASTIAVDLRPVLAGREPGPALQPGDSVIVRSTADARVHVELSGQFRNTGTFTLPAGSTLGQAVTLAGGLLPEAFPRGARLYRIQEAEVAKQFLADLLRRTEASLAINKQAAVDAADDESKEDAARNLARQEAELVQLRQATATGRMAGVDLARILAGEPGTDQVLQDGDRIDLPARPGTVRILGEVMVPGSQVFASGTSAKDLIRRSGGLTRQADEDSVFVVRADGSVVATAQGDTLAWDHERRRWARTSLSGLKLEEGDAVIIPADVRYKDTNRRIVRDWTQIMFQVAATVGTIAIIAK